MVTDSKGAAVVASCIHKVVTGSYRYTTLKDATDVMRNSHKAKSNGRVEKVLDRLFKMTQHGGRKTIRTR